MTNDERANGIRAGAYNCDVHLNACIAIEFLALPLGTFLLIVGETLAGVAALLCVAVVGFRAWYFGRKASSGMKILAEYIRRSPEGETR